MSKTHNELFPILGLKDNDANSFLEIFSADIEGFSQRGQYREGAHVALRRRDICTHELGVIGIHFAIIERTPEDTCQLIKRGLELCLEYLDGDYRKRLPKGSRMAIGHENLAWFQIYRIGVFFALLVEDEASLIKLSAWLSPGTPYDESSYLLKLEDNIYYKYLAKILVGSQDFATEVSTIKMGKRKRAKMLLECVEMILSGQVAPLISELNSYLKYFFKNSFAENGVYSYYSIEASVLAGLARRSGVDMDLDSLSPKHRAVIITPSTLGLSGG